MSYFAKYASLTASLIRSLCHRARADFQRPLADLNRAARILEQRPIPSARFIVHDRTKIAPVDLHHPDADEAMGPITGADAEVLSVAHAFQDGRREAPGGRHVQIIRWPIADSASSVPRIAV